MARQPIREDEPKDGRSTWRRRARRKLMRMVVAGELDYKCNSCGYVPAIVPTTEDQKVDVKDCLDANHRNKILSDLDEVNLEWLCRTCHLKADRVTAKGVSKIEDEFGYF